MTISVDKLDAAIMTILRDHSGKLEVAMVGVYGWEYSVNEELGEPASCEEIRAALKHLRNEGTLRLRKRTAENPGVWHEYCDGRTDDGWFFGTGKLEVAITDEGRRYPDVPRGRIGFSTTL